ncbi:hypothetical protein [Spirosoma foliorum]|uniref:Uncharacterized protein n=1 Tax=Spirosoma foliorum TaxID=2710596 RepID=A0A7G5H1E9_9BACT|nr:hypothetical protein [Spirosoma foliorum]QMW04941.1 hypothetical protein H3H32_08600 [Spirosoma foliorum]
MTTENKFTDLDDAPFVNEECGDTMWDESILDRLTESTTNQLGPSLSIAVCSPLDNTSNAKTGQSKQDNQE